MTIFLTMIMFLCGSLMFSYWLGLYYKKDIRTVGDGNPGAANLWHVAGYKFGLLGVFLDFSKAYIPLVFLVEGGSVTGNVLIPISLAPILGHAFSPFLRFRGGKAIAVTFGVWCAITRFEVALVYAILLALFVGISRIIHHGRAQSTEADSFQTVFCMLLLIVYLYARSYPVAYLWIWFGNLLILLYTNKYHLRLFYETLLKKERNQDHHVN